ncbi:alpha/beta hydrolase [Actinosynnema sp. CS-041913]|uniref:alpha/beta hydrolase n=1 Tax=Actinosynnema sp. CS-041913 TaxID=3239917 RepID=UPI003D902E27
MSERLQLREVGDHARLVRQLDAHHREHHTFWPYTAAETSGPITDSPRHCAHWPTPRHSPPVRAGHYPAVPVLAISGEFDIGTTPAHADTIVARYPNARAVTVPYGRHGLLLGLSPAANCAQAAMLDFLANPRTDVPVDCTARTHRMLGRFPTTAPLPTGGDLTDGQRERIAAAAHTAEDALALLDPEAAAPAASEPGLRGGRLTITPDGITLDAARFTDTPVSGAVGLDGTTATFTAPGLELTWTPFRAGDFTQVSGTVDGQGFAVEVPPAG